MLATQRMSPPNPLFTGNQAGAPLPLVPRRLSSSALPVRVLVQQSPPSLPLDDSDSSSSSDSGRPTVSIRAKRVGSENSKNDATPRRPPLLYSPGVSLRLTPTRNYSESHAPNSSTTTGSLSSTSSREPLVSAPLSSSQSQPRLIRKKSGQLVKSSLKPSKSLSLLTPCSPYPNYQSAPATPTHTPKNVHFDAQLEHVKLFLAEQKPLAVSRDGSPTEDTASGTDTDFPDWIYGSNFSSPSPRNLKMHHINMPPRLSADNNDVLLESLEVSSDAPSVVGRVRVANLAYAKSVVARFTFDAWQTTSEVSAQYVSSPSPRTDIFVFSVRLNDLMARIDGKRMCLAIRYSVEGRELWDNNGGRDYVVEFGLESKSERERERELEREKEDRSRRPTPDPNTIASLRSTLEKVVAPSPTPSSSRPVPRYNFSQSPSNRWVPPQLPHTPQTSLNPAQLSTHSRTQSYPSPGTTPRPIPKPNANANSIPWPAQRGGREKEKERWTPPLGSPRDASDEDRPTFAGAKYSDANSETRDLPFAVSPHHHTQTQTHIHTPTPSAGGRHHRRGYFADGANKIVSGVRRTPPGSPPAGSESDGDGDGESEGEGEGDEEGEKTPMPGRSYSFPPTSSGSFGVGRAGGGMGVALGEGVGIGMRMRLRLRLGEESELSTPSFGSSRAASPSPSPSPTDSEVPTETDDTETEGEDDSRIGASDSGNGSYKEFLSRFCFFTGTGTATGVGLFPDSPHSPPHALPPHSSHVRAHTYPHLQKRFIGPRTQSASPKPSMAVRSTSLDDVLLGSGATTPVGRISSPPLL